MTPAENDTADRLAMLAAALERRDFGRASTLAASFARAGAGEAPSWGFLSLTLPSAVRLALVALVVALEGLTRELIGRAEADARAARVAATSDAAREVARALREIGSLDVDDVRRLDSMGDRDLLRLAHLIDKRLEASANARGSRVIEVLERQRRTPQHRFASMLAVFALEAWDLTLRETFIAGNGELDPAREVFRRHVRERLSQPITAAALEVDVDLDLNLPPNLPPTIDEVLTAPDASALTRSIARVQRERGCDHIEEGQRCGEIVLWGGRCPRHAAGVGG